MCEFVLYMLVVLMMIPMQSNAWMYLEDLHVVGIDMYNEAKVRSYKDAHHVSGRTLD